MIRGPPNSTPTATLLPYTTRFRARAADLELLGDVLAVLRHGVGAVELLHLRIDEAPADGGVVDLGGAGEGGAGLGHHEVGPGHVLDAAGDRQAPFAGLDHAGGVVHRLHAGRAQPVDGAAGDAGGQPGQPQRHAGDVAVVLARLVDAAVVDLVDRFRSDERRLGKEGGRPCRYGVSPTP